MLLNKKKLWIRLTTDARVYITENVGIIHLFVIGGSPYVYTLYLPHKRVRQTYMQFLKSKGRKYSVLFVMKLIKFFFNDGINLIAFTNLLLQYYSMC